MLDHGILNLPLAKRGNIDAQIDRWKAEQAKAARISAKEASAKRNALKVEAKAFYAQHGAAFIDRYVANHNRSEFRQMVESMVKWEPEKFMRLANKSLVSA